MRLHWFVDLFVELLGLRLEFQGPFGLHL